MLANLQKPFVLTSGDAAGIGVDIVLTLAKQGKLNQHHVVIVLGDKKVFEHRAQMLGFVPTIKIVGHFSYESSNSANAIKEVQQLDGKQTVLTIRKVVDNFYSIVKQGGVDNSCIYLFDIPCLLSNHTNYSVSSLLEDKIARAVQVLVQLKISFFGANSNTFSGIVTAPLNKSVTQLADVSFVDHTNYYGKLAGNSHPVMMLMTDTMKVALATIHHPLRAVPDLISKELLETVIENLHQGLVKYFAKQKPILRVSGLNPHAGEAAMLGHEEIEIINPVIASAQKNGWQVFGSYPADTLFTETYLRQTDAFLVMYHDQGLPVLKYSGFKKAVNVTLGLPFIRTSVDHGTAYDLVGTGMASSSSLEYAIETAHFMLVNLL